jgi:Flp pilus assembly protein TadG
MPELRQDHSASRKTRTGESGQALMEFIFVLPILLILALGLIDASRAIFQQQVIDGLARDASAMAARGTPFNTNNNTTPGTVFYILTYNSNTSGTSPLDVSTYGRIIITPITNTSSGAPVYQVAAGGQYTYGSCHGCTTTTSQFAPGTAGTVLGQCSAVLQTGCLPATPPGGAPFPQYNQTIYATEIYYAYQPLTFIGQLLNPSHLLYDVAYI